MNNFNENDFENKFSNQDNSQPITKEVGFEAEQKVLSAILNNYPCNEVFNTLTKDDFQNIYHKQIFIQADKFNSEMKRIEPNIIIDNLVAEQLLSHTEASNFVFGLMPQLLNPDSLNLYINLVKIASVQRQLQQFGSRLHNITFDYFNYDEQVLDLENDFLSILQNKHNVDIHQISTYIDAYKHRLIDAVRNKLITGTQTSYPEIDRLTGGFQPGDLIILAARPGRGKTAFAINLLSNIAKLAGEDEIVVMFSLEMGIDQIIHRLSNCESMVNYNFSNAYKLDQDQKQSVTYSLEQIKE